jgi:hypothetical protein
MQPRFSIFIFSAALSLSCANVSYAQSRPEAACISQALNGSPQKSTTLIEARAFQPNKESLERSFFTAYYHDTLPQHLLTFNINDVMRILTALGGINAKDEEELRSDFTARRFDEGRQRAEDLMLGLISSAFEIKIRDAVPSLQYSSCFIGKGGMTFLRLEGGTF